MILRLLLLLLAFVPLNVNLQAGLWDDFKGMLGIKEKPAAPTIRILVVHDVEGVNLEVRGKYSLYDPYTNSYISSRLIGKSRYIQALGDGLKWGEAFPGLYQIKIRPDEADTVTIIDNKEYQGNIYIYDIGGTISIVNEIPVEDYIASIMSRLETLRLHPETWSALAIAARTNAYFQAVNPKNTYWAVDSQKVEYEGAHKPRNPDIKDALNVTRHMIMSRTGVYEGLATPFAAQFGPLITGKAAKDAEVSKISLEEADEMARNGEHAAQILAKAFPGTTIMLMQYSNP